MSYTKKTTKAGIVYYQFKILLNTDPITKHQEFYTESYYPQGHTNKQIEKELNEHDALLKAKKKTGELIPKKDIIKESKKQAVLYSQEMTFSEYVDVVLSDHSYSVNSPEAYRCALNRAVERFGDMKISSITSAMIKVYINDLQQAVHVKTGQPLAYGTIRNHITAIRMVFNRAYDAEIIDKNPCAKIKMPRKPKDEEEKIKFLTMDQMLILKDYVKFLPPIWYALISVLMYTGCRVGECVGLKWEDINFETGEIAIRNNVQKVKGGYVLNNIKNGNSRTVLVNDDVLIPLKKLRETVPPKYTGFCFAWGNGKAPIATRYVDDRLRKIAKICGIEHLSAHMFRHTFISFAVNNGADIASVAKTVGDTPRTIMEVYVHALEDASKKTSQAFVNAFNTED